MKRCGWFVLVLALTALLAGCGGEESENTASPPEIAAADLPTVEVSAEGDEFDPAVQVAQLPPEAWYCDMGTVHYARAEEGDGHCPLCGMQLVHNITRGPEKMVDPD